MLLTGGSGFVGRNIMRGLNGNYDITAPRHSELDLLSSDSTSRFLREHDFDFVIHCANVGGNRKNPDNADIVGKNLRMFINLEDNRDRFGRMIHFGSGAEYDKSRPLACVTEEDFGKSVPADDYGFSKYAISKVIEGKDKICCLRLFGVFGPGEDYEYKFISNAIVKNLLGMPITIMQNVYFDWIYIDDLVGIVERFLKQTPSHKFYNATTGRTTDLITIAKIINEHADKDSEICVVNEGLNREYSGDNSLLTKEYGDIRFTGMDEAIAQLIRYYSSILDKINTDKIRQDPYAKLCAINRPRR